MRRTFSSKSTAPHSVASKRQWLPYVSFLIFATLTCGLTSHANAREAQATLRSMTLLESGLGADALACAGAPSGSLAELFTAVDSCASTVSVWRASQAARDELARQHEILIKQAAEAGADDALAVQIEASQVSLEQTQQSESEARLAAITALTSSLADNISGGDLASLRIAAMNSRRVVPAEYRVLSLSEAQWFTLESAVRKSGSGEQSFTPDESALVSWVNLQPVVQLARTRHAQSLPAVQQEFAAAMQIEAASLTGP